MNSIKVKTAFRAILGFAALLLMGSMVTAQSSHVQGLITGRSGATMTIKSQDSETVVVVLTVGTQVQEVEGAFKMRKKELGLTALIPGLPVHVKDSINGQHQLVADTVKFKGSDLKTAQDIQAGLAPTQPQVQANQAEIHLKDPDYHPAVFGLALGCRVGRHLVCETAYLCPRVSGLNDFYTRQYGGGVWKSKSEFIL